MENKSGWFYKWIQISTCLVFLGRAWQHLFFDAPYRELFWDESLMSPLIRNLFGWDWKTYVTSASIDLFFQKFIQGIGVFYLILAGLTCFAQTFKKWLFYLLPIGGLSLVFLAFLYSKAFFWSAGQFFEYSLQFGSPFFFWILLFRPNWKQSLTNLVVVSIAVTFICHGLYAIGYYPRPALFLTMFMNVFDVSNSQAIVMLNIAAYGDFLVSALLFTGPKWRAYALIYCVIWGFLTAFARIIGNFHIEWWQESLFQWTPEFLYRTPHFLIPLALLFKKGN